jgi:uncharacterized membrane protein
LNEDSNEDPIVSSQVLETEQMDQLIGRLLQFGVLAAAIVVLTGGLALLARHGSAPAAFQTFSGEKDGFTNLGAIFRGVLAGDPRAITQFGLVLLIATPLARVALTLGSFIHQKDKLYIGITALVLGVLLYGLLWGAG